MQACIRRLATHSLKQKRRSIAFQIATGKDRDGANACLNSLVQDRFEPGVRNVEDCVVNTGDIEQRRDAAASVDFVIARIDQKNFAVVTRIDQRTIAGPAEGLGLW